MLSIETSRLRIRCFRPDDWPALQELSVSYQATPAARLEPPWPTSEEGVRGLAAWFAKGDDYLAACLKDTGKLVGLVAVERRGGQERTVHNLGYVFHPDYHGQGYATEACRAAMAHVFGCLEADEILTGTHVENVDSIRLLRRLGLRETGTTSGEYRISREEWLAREREKSGRSDGPSE
jgi:RimJ/RimL family protein N-acetyltransferase